MYLTVEKAKKYNLCVHEANLKKDIECSYDVMLGQMKKAPRVQYRFHKYKKGLYTGNITLFCFI